ncbi:MAG: adenylate kinase [Cryomorphaceae bacterium MED-G14]|nr:MAG: adenylate kinase [Cryomorphaceae bacterium MED-G14]|tara:strand:- start:118 stop:699 length:582 start_codon:yes stop_codon:yes gene_type:complete
MLNIILFGKPGSGKGTQASFIKDKYSLIHISTGDVFRKNMSNNTELGLLAKGYMEKGELVPDIVTVNMLKDEINSFMPCNGFIFDGFPRTTFQAKELDDLLLDKSLKIDLTIALDVDNNSLIERLLERGKSSGRVDDQSVEKINIRLKEYDNKTKPLIDYYNDQNKFYSVNGIGSLEQITSRIEEVIEEFNNE